MCLNGWDNECTDVLCTDVLCTDASVDMSLPLVVHMCASFI